MKIFKYLLMASVTFIITSCVQDEDDLFSSSAAQRMNEAVEKYKEVLESAEGGWEMQFYPNHDGQMAGVIYTARFVEGTVSLRCETAEDPEVESKSLYQVKGEQECLLTFDSYNEVLHKYSEPQGSNNVTGDESDYEFAFKSVSEDGETVILKGKRYGQPLILKRLHEDGAEYISKIAEMSKKVKSFPRTFALLNGTDTLDISLIDGVLSYPEESYVADEDDPSVVDTVIVTTSVAAVTTLTGLHLQRAVTYGGVTFQDLTYVEEDMNIMAEGVNVAFPPVLPEGYRTYEELEGRYTVITDSGVTPITITANGDGKTYTIKGMLYSGLDVQASYNSAYGSLEIRVQYLGKVRTYDSWLIVYYDGYVSWSTSLGMYGRNDDAGNIKFYSNSTSNNITMFYEYLFTGDPSSATVAGWYTRVEEPVVFTRVD